MENRIFPAMLANKCAMFNFQDCRFHVRKRKETSGRVVSVFCSCPVAVRKPWACVWASSHPLFPLFISSTSFRFTLISSSALLSQRQHRREEMGFDGPLVRCSGGVEAVYEQQFHSRGKFWRCRRGTSTTEPAFHHKYI